MYIHFLKQTKQIKIEETTVNNCQANPAVYTTHK